MDEVGGYSPRYITPGSLESNYTSRDQGKRREIANTQIYGIVPSLENKVTNWGEEILEGDFLSDDDTGKVLLGMYTLKKYAPTVDEAERAMGEVEMGDKVLLTIDGKTNEFVVKGVLGGKTDAARQAYISATDMRKILGNGDTRATTINIKSKKAGDESYIKKVLMNNDLGENQKVQTYDEAEPSFVQDLKKVFVILGAVISGVGLAVAFITIFIVIYINAITRRKYIGIMKAIGITPKVVELSYVFQSIFYGVTGSFVGALLVYLLLVPYFTHYPINFPFSDGIMVAPYVDTFIKFIILMIATILAGYLPSRSIINQNTLNAILGR
jgi:putative ABC transport system permease protein